MRVYCEYAEAFDEGEECPNTGQTNCFIPLCMMLETGCAYASDETDEND